jgi:hypothetical protein
MNGQHVTVDTLESFLDIEGVVGDDLEFAIFFGYLPVTGYTFSAFIELEPPPLQKVYPLTVTVLDAANGLIQVSLARADSLKIGPVSGCRWKLSWVETGHTMSVAMGLFALNRL